MIERKGEKIQQNVLGGYLQESKLAGKEWKGDKTVYGTKQKGESEGCKVCGDVRRKVQIRRQLAKEVLIKSFRWLKAEREKEMERRKCNDGVDFQLHKGSSVGSSP